MNNSTVVTALLFVVACISTAGFVQERLDKEASSKTLENNVSVLTENVEKLATQEVEIVTRVKETRTEISQDEAFELLLGKGNSGVNVELDGQGRYWLIERSKGHKFYREEK